MPGKGEVYLVSAKSSDNTPEVKAYDNIGFKPSNDDQVTFNSSKGNDLTESRPKPSAPYRGMGKEDLLHFSTQPFWRRLRMIFVSIIILGWLALIITVVALVLVYPKCRDPESRSWWQKESVYRIYVPSFKDSDNDGVGDLKGIETKLDYIKNLGFSILSLSPFYKVDFKDLNTFKDGNDLAITNHTDVLDRYGTLNDFDNLLQQAHDKGMYVVVDFIPTQTSNSHPWFVESKSSTNNDMKNFYVWADGAAVPNNWKSKNGGSAWTQDTTRNQYYLHQTSDTTPDLNLRSSMVLDELEAIINFWLDRDVDGFNIRNAAYMFVDYDLRDEPNLPGNTGSNYEDLDHTYTRNQPELYGVLNRWRALVRDYNKTEKVRVLMSGVDGGLDVTDVYQECGRSGIQMPLNLLDASMPCEGNCMRNYIDGWMNEMPSGKWATWMAGDENTDRFASRFNASFVQAFTVLTYLLPGTPILYNGDELTMINTGTAGSIGTRNQPMRAVMAWNATQDNFCNSTCTPWTDVSEVSSKEAMYRNLLRELADLRTNVSFRVGEYHPAIRDNSIVSYVREFDGESGYLVAVNFGPNSVTRDYTVSHDTIPMEAAVVLSHRSSQDVEDDVDPSSLEIGAFGALVVSWDYVAKEL